MAKGHAIGVERLLTFSDAVFAIAITLLALDIRVPYGLADDAVDDALADAIPHVAAYLLSFVVIGLLWMDHHGIFAPVARLDPVMLRLELAFLAVIAALPFPTQLISEYGRVPAVTAIYAGSMTLAGLLMTGMAIRIRSDPGLRHPDVPQRQLNLAILDSLFFALVFAVSIPIAFISSLVAQLSWLVLIPIGYALGRSRTRNPVV